MSRVGNNPILVPEDVNVEIHENSLEVSGKLGALTQDFDGVSVSKVEGQLVVKRNSESKDHKAKHGLYRWRDFKRFNYAFSHEFSTR